VLIPASGRAMLSAVLIWLDPLGKSVFPVGLFVLLLIAIAAMAGLWRILGAFIFKGAACFQGIHRFWWSLAIAGAVIVVAALPLNLWYRIQFALPDSPMTDFVLYMSVVGYAGIYLLMPFAHVSIERWRQTRPASHLEVTVVA
jgi:hypothetical protein